MSLPLVYLVITALAALLLLALLVRGGLARPMTVWGLTALLPLLVALSVALGSQARAEVTLKTYRPQSAAVVITTGGQEYDAVLTAGQAACLERSRRLRTDADLVLGEGRDPIPLRSGFKVTGELPTQAQVEALSVRGQLTCPEFRHVEQTK